MTTENILVSIVAIIASFAALVVVALVIDYPKRIWHHLTGGTYKPLEEVASAHLAANRRRYRRRYALGAWRDRLGPAV